MARAPKEGIDYFPFDVSFFSDRKIKILRARYGADGIELYLYILCEVYRDKGYYLKIDDDFYYTASDDLNMNYEKIGQIMNFLLERSLLDNTLFKSDKVLTSRGIQNRFQQAVKVRATKNPVEVDKKMWLLEEDKTESYIKVIKNQDLSKNNGNKSEINAHLSEEESHKVKESKVKESKEKKSIYGEFGNVALTEEEYVKLQTAYPDYQDRIERLSAYIASTGKRYKSHYATILNWARKDGGNRTAKPKETSFMDIDVEGLL